MYLHMTHKSESSESYFLFFTSNNMFTLLTYIISKSNFIDARGCDKIYMLTLNMLAGKKT